MAIAREHHRVALEHRWDQAARLIADKNPEFLSDHQALVDVGDRRRIAVSAGPFRDRTSDGRLALINGDLRLSGDQWAPINPITEVHLPARANGAIELPRSDLRILPLVGAAASAALETGSKLFYGNANPSGDSDIDLIVEPTIGGAETLYQLRRAGHQELRLRVLGDIRLAPASGGTDIVRNGQRIGGISSATAVDAAGQAVPVATSIDGQDIVLDIAGSGYEAPIMVDPTIGEYYTFWDQGTSVDFGGWTEDRTTGYIAFHKGGSGPIYDWGRGLYVYLNPVDLGSGGRAEWRFDPKGDSFVESINTFGLSQWYGSGGYPTGRQACSHVGIWSPDTWEVELKNVYLDGSGTSSGQLRARASCSYRNHGGEYHQGVPGTTTAGHPNNYAFFKLEGSGNIVDRTNTYMSGAVLYVGDDRQPDFTSSLPATDATWTNRATTTIRPTASDAGLGMKYIDVTEPGPHTAIATTCLGVRTAECPANLPSGNGDTNQDYITFTSPEGIFTHKIKAEDIIGNRKWHEWTWSTDRSKPKFDLQPVLPSVVEPVGEELTGGYEATVIARDGDERGLRSARRSGVKRIDVWMKRPGDVGFSLVASSLEGGSCQGQHPDTRAEQTVTDSCPKSYTYKFPTNDPQHPTGQYVVRFVATDHAGNAGNLTDPDLDGEDGVREWTFVKADTGVASKPKITSTDHDPTYAGPTAAKPGWIHNHQATVHAEAADVGSGLYQMELLEPLSTGNAKQIKRFQSVNSTEPCDGTLPRLCPPMGGQDFTYNIASWREGYSDGVLTAVDAAKPSGNPSNSNDATVVAPNPFRLKVDRTAPKLSFADQLSTFRNGTVLDTTPRTLETIAKDGVYDGNPDGIYSGRAADARSGVASLALRTSKDGAGYVYVARESDPNSCPVSEDACEQHRKYTVNPADWGEGVHRINVIARDRMAESAEVHQSSGTFAFLIDFAPPKIDAITPDPPVPADWVSNRTIDISVDTSDTGSGVRRIVLSLQTPTGRVERSTDSTDVPCQTHNPASRCPRDPPARQLSFNTADLVEGVSDVIVWAEDAAGRKSEQRSWRIQVDRTPPAFPQEWLVTAMRDASTGEAVVDWDPALDPDVSAGESGSGVRLYRYRYCRGNGECSVWAETNVERAVVPESVIGTTLTFEISATDQALNASGARVSQVTVTDGGDVCQASANGIPAECVRDSGGEDFTEPPVVLEPESETTSSTVQPSESSATSAYRYRVRVGGGGWATIRRGFNSYAIGNVRDGWLFDQVRQDYTNTLGWITGRVYGNFGTCGWIQAAPGSGTEVSTACEPNYRPNVERFADGWNCSSCNRGTPIQVLRPYPECRNVSPTPVDRVPTDCVDKIGTRTTDQAVSRGTYVVQWRYTTNDNRFVMVRDTNVKDATQGVWVFIDRRAFRSHLCSRDAMRKYDCGPVS